MSPISLVNQAAEALKAGRPRLFLVNTSGTLDAASHIHQELMRDFPDAITLQISLLDDTHYQPLAVATDLVRQLALIARVDWNALLDKWDGFNTTREIIRNYISGRSTERAERLIPEELNFEQSQIRQALVFLLSRIVNDRPVVVGLQNAHQMPASSWKFFLSQEFCRADLPMVMVGSVDIGRNAVLAGRSAHWRDVWQQIEASLGIMAFSDVALAQGPNLSGKRHPVQPQPIRNSISQQLALAIDLAQPEDAIDYAWIARHAPQSKDDQLALHMHHGYALLLINEPHAAVEQLQLAFNLTGPADSNTTKATIYHLLFVAAACMFDIPTAEQHALQALKFANADGDTDIQLDIYIFLTIWGEYFSPLFTDGLYDKILTRAVKQNKLNYFGMAARKAHMFYPNSDSNSLRYVASRCEASIARYESINNLHGLAAAYHEASVAESRRNHLARATEYLERSYAIRCDLGNALEIIKGANGLGHLYQQQGKYAEAYQIARGILADVIKTKNWPEVGVTLFNLGDIAFQARNYPQAVQLLSAVRDMMDILEQDCFIFHSKRKVLSLLSFALASVGQHQEASALFRLAACLPLGDSFTEYYFHMVGAKVIINNPAEATHHQAEAMRYVKQLPTLAQQIEIFLWLERYADPLERDVASQELRRIVEKYELATVRIWMEGFPASYTRAITELPGHDLDLAELMLMIQQDANIRAVQKHESDLQFRAKLNQLCVESRQPKAFAAEFCQLLYEQLNLAELAVVAKQEDCLELLGCYPEPLLEMPPDLLEERSTLAFWEAGYGLTVLCNPQRKGLSEKEIDTLQFALTCAANTFRRLL